jgi:hypothetical protein
MEGTLMHKGDSTTGWTAYVEAFKAKHPTAIIDYKVLLTQYIKGVKV